MSDEKITFDFLIDTNLSEALTEIYDLCDKKYQKQIIKEIPNFCNNISYSAPEIRNIKEWERIYILISKIPASPEMNNIWKNALKKSKLYI